MRSEAVIRHGDAPVWQRPGWRSSVRTPAAVRGPHPRIGASRVVAIFVAAMTPLPALMAPTTSPHRCNPGCAGTRRGWPGDEAHLLFHGGLCTATPGVEPELPAVGAASRTLAAQALPSPVTLLTDRRTDV